MKKAITPDKHMKLLESAWKHGISKEATERYLYLNMRFMLDSFRAAGKSDDYIKGYEAAMNHAKDLIHNTITYYEIADIYDAGTEV